MQPMFSAFQNGLSRAIRATGQTIDSLGQRLELHPHVDKLLPSLRRIPLKNRGRGGIAGPQFNGVSFIAPCATVVGKVSIGAKSSIWYGAVLRGDDSSITIGDGVTIGDRVMVHCSSFPQDMPTVISSRSIVGTGAILHGCKIEEGAVVGEGAQVMDGAIVGAGSQLAAGSFLASGKVVPPKQLWAGVPARYVREISSTDLLQVQKLTEENINLAVTHAQEVAKDWQQIEWEEFQHDQQAQRSPEYYRRLSPDELSKRIGEFEGHSVPGRVLNTPITAEKASIPNPLK